MKVAEIRDLSPDELKARIIDARKDIVDLRFQLAARKLEKPHKVREARKLLSTLLTIQTEKVDKDIKAVGKNSAGDETKSPDKAKKAAKDKA